MADLDSCGKYQIIHDVAPVKAMNTNIYLCFTSMFDWNQISLSPRSDRTRCRPT